MKRHIDALEEVIDWLHDQIDGGDECRGRDGVISHHIRGLEAAQVELRRSRNATLEEAASLFVREDNESWDWVVNKIRALKG